MVLEGRAKKGMIKKRSVKAGLPPGSLVHVGEKKGEDAIVTATRYNEAMYVEEELKDLSDCLPLQDESAVIWIDIDLVHQVDLIARVGECFRLHPLVVEDILNTDQRPKMEDFGDYLYVVFRFLSCNGLSGSVESEQVSLVVGPGYVISFQERGVKVFDKVRERIRAGKGRLRKSGADYLAYSLLDAVVDDYFIVLERLGDRIENLEDGLIATPGAATLHAIHGLKRELLFLRRSVWPLREVLNGLQREDCSQIGNMTRIYLRDVYDHTIHVIDTLETFRDTISGMLDIYLSSISNRLNEVMKVLTIISTIFIPLTFLSGVYGMNFRYMPELGWKWGYPALLVLMLGVALTMVSFFKRKKWF